MNDNKDIICNSELIVMQTFMPKGPLYRPLKPVPETHESFCAGF